MTGLDLESFLLLLRADLSVWLMLGLATSGLGLSGVGELELATRTKKLPGHLVRRSPGVRVYLEAPSRGFSGA